MTQDPIATALHAFSTCDISDALLKLNQPHGGFLADLTLWSPKRQEGPTKVVGSAYTVKYVRHTKNSKTTESGHYIDSIPPGSVVFVSAPPNIVNAVYGGLMSNRAKVAGAVGTVVDGRIRDLNEHRELDYPVFARNVGTASPYEVVHVSEINVPVRLQSTEQEAIINPGDYLVGDLNGVVCLPRHLAEKVLALMGPQVEADRLIALDIQQGKSFLEASKEHRSVP
ncbi:hypothetical protein PILCRDRAFT_813171 [Piloderma croceum F 1598]|uniref:Uncharacterized protein n=1 Tax=Piloderma croceum (strain F 1598) TaxID=765440 RepID=A0A0C3BRV2_PILCF|nr:hypothetical protein PILCRDRAFT_813171 [Piloderma croceum F 1598]